MREAKDREKKREIKLKEGGGERKGNMIKEGGKRTKSWKRFRQKAKTRKSR